MLPVEDRFMIKDLHRTGVSISEIARRTGHDRKTIRSVIETPLVAERPARPAKARKIDPYVSYLTQRLAEGVLNARKLYDEIVRQGYAGKERQVRLFVQTLRQPRPPQATRRVETEPGHQAQVDGGHFGLIQHQGRQQRLYAFVMMLGWSRTMYVEFTVSTDIAIFLRGHVHAFDYFGGVPRQMLHDNLKTAVLGREADGTVRFHPRYLDLADYYGFTPRACQPYRAQTKGKVESGVKYVRGNFWLGLTYRDLADLNTQARQWLDTVANVRLHGTTNEAPFTRLAQEGLLSLVDKPAYDTSHVTTRRSSREGLVSYDGNYYSVPAAYTQQVLTLKQTEQAELVILSAQGEEIARHAVAVGHHQRVVVAAHYQGLATASSAPTRAGATQLVVAEPALAGVLAAPQVEARPLSVYDQVLEGAA
jgi:transposase